MRKRWIWQVAGLLACLGASGAVLAQTAPMTLLEPHPARGCHPCVDT
jgi:hypothetical protein